MYIVQKFTVGDSFIVSARAAIREAYEKNKRAPNEVLVQPSTDIGNATFVAVMLEREMHQIPLRVAEYLKTGFRLEDNEAVLDVCDPNDQRE